jgi:mono/diheme cytochrome c family protein
MGEEAQMKRSALTGLVAGWCILTTGGHASAASPLEIQRAIEADARQAAPGFAGFSAQRGQQFFNARHGGDWSCATCHTADPRQPGRHARTGKSIAPLAPAANPERFTSPATVDKWFRRNCNDVLGRTCTAQEKGDVLAWLTTIRK